MKFDGAGRLLSRCKDDLTPLPFVRTIRHHPTGNGQQAYKLQGNRPLHRHISCSALILDRARRSQSAATREARGRAGNDVSSPFIHLLDLRSSPSPLPSSKATIDVDLLELINHPFHSTCNLTFAIRQIRSIPLYHLDILIYTHA